MNSIFEKSSYENIIDRLGKLTRNSTPLWGKMNVSQMLHHLNLTVEAPLGKIQTKGKPNFFMKMFKNILYNDKPFGKGSPTPKDFKISGNYDFETEKAKYLSNLHEVYIGGKNRNYSPHIFFGKLTSDQWGMHIYKHTDHHLKQFGL
ncbi:MAG: DUF1569 domain-containing protein [Flavisolibacter sp.]